ncbi:hypothetical protein GCM10029976_049210 [Kribbella albertanoniae]
MKLTGDDIPVAAARRIALGAQGFAGRRPVGRIDVRRMRSAIGDAGVLQVDAVNVLTRAHYLPLFSRLGNYSRERLDQLSWGPKAELFEFFWAHKAALLPVSYFPLLRHRMRAAEQQDWSADLAPEITAPWSVVVGMRRLRAERPGFVEQVLATITEQGPLTAGQISPDDVRRKRSDPDPDPTTGSMWNWQDAKIAVEYLFCAGLVSIAGRGTSNGSTTSPSGCYRPPYWLLPSLMIRNGSSSNSPPAGSGSGRPPISAEPVATTSCRPQPAAGSSRSSSRAVN